MTRNRKTDATSRIRNNSRRRGYSYEQRVARDMGGSLWSGQNGDVEARGFRIECKYRTGLNLKSGATLREWIEQAKRNVASMPGKNWAIAFTGGRFFNNNESYYIIPRHVFDELTKPEPETDLEDRIEKILKKNGVW